MQIFLMHRDKGSSHPRVTYSFGIKKVGEDGNGNPVYVGECDIDGSGAYKGKCCVIMRKNGTVLGIKTGKSYLQAAEHIIQSKRKGYGPHYEDFRSIWPIPESEQEVDGYEIE